LPPPPVLLPRANVSKRYLFLCCRLRLALRSFSPLQPSSFGNLERVDKPNCNRKLTWRASNVRRAFQTGYSITGGTFISVLSVRAKLLWLVLVLSVGLQPIILQQSDRNFYGCIFYLCYLYYTNHYIVRNRRLLIITAQVRTILFSASFRCLRNLKKNSTWKFAVIN